VESAGAGSRRRIVRGGGDKPDAPRKGQDLWIKRLTWLRAWFGVFARPFGEDITPGVAAVS
jgi:hypothetical protein